MSSKSTEKKSGRSLLPAKRAYNVGRGLFITLLVVVTGWRLAVTDMADSDGVIHQTPIAHRMTIPFEDKSTVDMNASTVALIKDMGSRRRLFFTDGEVRITVPHGIGTPIDVYLPHVVLEDHGTQFNVSAHDTFANVTVTSGSVQVWARDDDGSLEDPIGITSSGLERHPLVLAPGDSVRLEEHDGSTFAYLERNDLKEAQSRSAWLSGEVLTSGRRLDEVAAEFNRYNNVRILIEDPDVARMHLGGHYVLTKPEQFLSHLEMAGLQAVPVPPGAVDDRNMIQRYVLRNKESAADVKTSHKH